MTTSERADLHRLFMQASAGTLSEAEGTLLDSHLRRSAEARRLWFQHQDIELGLAEFAVVRPYLTSARLPPAPQAPAVALSDKAWRSAVLHYGAVAVIAVLLTLGAVTWQHWFKPPIERRLSDTTDYVATLASGNDCVWGGSRTLLAGQRIPAGILKLERGQALVNFDGGARMVLLAPVEVAFESAGSVRVHHGKIAVRAPEEAVGFKVATKEGVVVDLGTEFTVDVNEKGATECHVLDGEIEWHPAFDTRKTALLTEGQARRFIDGRSEVVAAVSGHYRDFVPSVNASAALGKLLAYEPFNYTDSDALAETLGGGFGWRSPWLGGIPPYHVDEEEARMHLRPRDSLRSPAGLVASQGGSFVFHKERQWRFRALPVPIDFGADGVYYLSFLARREPVALSTENKPGRLAINFRSSKDFWSHYIGFTITSSDQPVAVADGNNRWSGETLPTREVLFVVCKVTTSRDGADQLFMKVSVPGDEIEASDTARWTVTSRPLNFDLALDYLLLGAIDGMDWRLDELRFGTSWNAVVPMASVSVKPASSNTVQ